ncbi:MAG: MarR family transcriptional regulator [Clostridiales bacterium]|nr:MarR family transcriptional regulator [Clostridiales bacterium]
MSEQKRPDRRRHRPPPDDRRHGPPPEEMPIMMLVNELSRLFHNRMRVAGEKVGMQEGFRHLLFHLAREDDLTQLDLVRRAHLKAPTVSVALRKMEDAGLVTRTADPEDLRQTRVLLTDKGRRLDDRMRESIHRTETMAADGLTEEEQQTLRRMLLRVRGNLLEQEEGVD